MMDKPDAGKKEMPAGGLFEEKVASYLDGLSPEARRMLMRRLGRNAEADPAPAQAPHTTDFAGILRDDGVSTSLPLSAFRAHSAGATVLVDARSVVFEPFLPFVMDDLLPTRQPGWLRSESFDTIWTYLVREAMPERFAPWQGVREMTPTTAQAARENAIPALRTAAFAHLARIEAEGRRDSKVQQKFTARIGGETALADLMDMVAIAPRLPQFESLFARLPGTVPAVEAAERPVGALIGAALAAEPRDAVYIAAALANRLASAASLIRIACQVSEADDIAAVRRSVAAPLIDVALSAAERHAVRFATLLNTRCGADDLLAELRAFHEIVRSATLTVNVDDDRQWKHRLARLRRAISEPLASAVDGVVPAIRLALMGDRSARPDEADHRDAIRAAALLAAARRYRDSLAVNAVVNRLWPIADQALQTYGRPALDRLRKAEGDERDDLAASTAVLVEISAHIHGDDYAQHLARAREKALRG